MKKIQIRPAREGDAEAIVAILAGLAMEIGDDAYFRSDADAIRRHGFGSVPMFRCLVAEGRGETLGLTLYYPVFSTTRGQPGVYVQDLWVAEGARKSGLGRRLLAETAARAAADWSAAYMALTVYADNPGATAFYRRQGFSSGERERFMALDEAAFQALRSKV
jgi:ribosomal protein S18 acetylase RimI-like enzyme